MAETTTKVIYIVESPILSFLSHPTALLIASK